MELYFAPLACSLATRIALYEAGADARFTEVDTKAKKLAADRSDFYTVNPMGQVPALRTDEGPVLTENTAVLQYVADRFPAANLAPAAGLERARLQQWLGFIGTEIHKAIFIPLLEPTAPAEAKAYAREKAALRFGILERHLATHEFLLDRFTIADAYLVTVLNWTRVTAVDLTEWPAVNAYHQRLLERPSIARAFGEEFALFQQASAAQR